MTKLVYGNFKGYANRFSKTKPGEVVVTRYDKNGAPIRKDHYEVTSEGYAN